MPSNLQKSEVVIARILKRLIDKGLQDSMLSFRSLDLDEEYEAFFKTCFIWLIDEGFVRSATNMESINSAFHAYDPVLTSKGFTVLGRHLELKDGAVTVASVVEETSSRKQSLASVGDFFGGLLGGFTKSIGS